MCLVHAGVGDGEGKIVLVWEGAKLTRKCNSLGQITAQALSKRHDAYPQRVYEERKADYG
jgi:hypothetical protein